LALSEDQFPVTRTWIRGAHNSFWWECHLENVHLEDSEGDGIILNRF